MGVRDEQGESLFLFDREEQVGSPLSSRRIFLSVLGFFGLFCIALGVGFLHQRQMNRKMDAYFQARRSIDVWDRKPEKRVKTIQKSEANLPTWVFSSPFVKGDYLQRKILSGFDSSPLSVDSLPLDKFPVVRDFQELTRLALSGDWKNALEKGEHFIKKYHLPSLLTKKEERSRLSELSLAEILVPIQYLRQVAFARELGDPLAEKQAIEAVARACSYEDVDEFLDLEKPLTHAHAMLEYCFNSLVQGSVSIRSYLSERLRLLQGMSGS